MLREWPGQADGFEWVGRENLPGWRLRRKTGTQTQSYDTFVPVSRSPKSITPDRANWLERSPAAPGGSRLERG